MSEDLDLNDEVLDFLREGETDDEEEFEGSLNSTNGTFSNRSDCNEDYSEEPGAALSPVLDPEQFFNIFIGTAIEGVISVLDLILHFTLNSYPVWIRHGIYSTISSFSESIPIRAQCQRNIVVLKFSFTEEWGTFDLSVHGRCNGGVIFGRHELDWHLWTLRVSPDQPRCVQCEHRHGIRQIPLLDYIFENVVVCYRDLKKKRNFLAACLVAVERDNPAKRIMLCNRLWAVFPGLWGQIDAVGKMVRFHQVTTDDYYKHTFAEDGWIEDPGINISKEPGPKREENANISSTIELGIIDKDLKRNENINISSNTIELGIKDKVFEESKDEALGATE